MAEVQARMERVRATRSVMAPQTIMPTARMPMAMAAMPAALSAGRP